MRTLFHFIITHHYDGNENENDCGDDGGERAYNPYVRTLLLAIL
jgi:hypothetical protein